MKSDELKELKNQFDQERFHILQNRAYVQGKNPTILSQYPKKEPDNRIPVAWGKMAVEDMAGYAGDYRPMWSNMTTVETAEMEAKEDDYIELMRRVLDWNDWGLTIAECFKMALGYGRAYILAWASDAMNIPGMFTPEFAVMKNTELQLVYSDDIKPVLTYAIRWMSDKVCHVYNVRTRETWTENNGEWTMNPDEELVHMFDKVPVAVFPINYEQKPLFEAEKALIDAHDQLISKSQNEIDRFNALIALFPGKIDKQFIQKLSEIKAIDDLGQYDHWPEYLEKSLMNINDFYNSLADRLERLYHKSIKVPDFSDENFSGQASGIALAYKLMGLEFKAATIEAYFKQGIVQLFELINRLVLIGTNGLKPDGYKMTIKGERRLPVDTLQAVQVAVQLQGIGVSKETILNALPAGLIDDVAKELDRMVAETPAVPDILAE